MAHRSHLNRLTSLLAGIVLTLVTAIPRAAPAAETLTFIHTDALGSPVAATDQQGNVIWREEYKPYGERIKNEPAAQTNTRWFTGHPHDAATGLTYMGARYYDAVVGRFMAVDPLSYWMIDKNAREGGRRFYDHSQIYVLGIKTGATQVAVDDGSLVRGFNGYAYVLNNPLRYIDPTGLDAKVTLYPGASGFGHVGIGVNSPNTTGFYPAPNASTWDVVTGQPVPGVMQPDTRTPTTTITIPATPAQDKAIQDYINSRIANPGNYDLNDRNCTTTVRDALGAGGINTPATIYPKELMRDLQRQFGGLQ